MKVVVVLSFFIVGSAFAVDLTSTLKSEFESNQEATCSVVSKKSNSSPANFNIYCENKYKTSSFSVVINDDILTGSGSSWLKGTYHQAECDIVGSISENVVKNLDVSCLHSVLSE